MSAGGGKQHCQAREMDWGPGYARLGSPPSPSSNGTCSTPATVCFNRPSLQQDNAIPPETESLPLTPGGGGQVTHPSWWYIPLQIPVGNFFPRRDGAWGSEQQSRLIHSESRGHGCFLSFPHLYSVGCIGRCPQSGVCGNRLYWLIIQIH